VQVETVGPEAERIVVPLSTEVPLSTVPTRRRVVHELWVKIKALAIPLTDVVAAGVKVAVNLRLDLAPATKSLTTYPVEDVLETMEVPKPMLPTYPT